MEMNDIQIFLHKAANPHTITSEELPEFQKKESMVRSAVAIASIVSLFFFALTPGLLTAFFALATLFAGREIQVLSANIEEVYKDDTLKQQLTQNPIKVLDQLRKGQSLFLADLLFSSFSQKNPNTVSPGEHDYVRIDN